MRTLSMWELLEAKDKAALAKADRIFQTPKRRFCIRRPLVVHDACCFVRTIQ